MFHQTDDLVHWPILRLASRDLLQTVSRFFIFNNGQSALLLTHKHEVFALGHNTKSSLGIHETETTNFREPKEVYCLISARIVKIREGRWHLMALTMDGELQGWGWNHLGQAGGNEANNGEEGEIEEVISWPAEVLSQVEDFSCGLYHTSALKSDGTVWCWGWNYYGQLGTGNRAGQRRPTQVNLPEGVKITALDCGPFNTVALANQSTVYLWGKFGLVEMDTPTEVQLSSEVNFTSITCGQKDFLLLDTKGTLHHCFYDSKRKFTCKSLENEDFNDSVREVIYPNVSLQGPYFLKLLSGRVTLFTPGKVIPTSLTSLPDACALYCEALVTPCLTILPSHALRKSSYESICGLNNPTLSDFEIQIGNRKIYLNQNIAKERSVYLQKLLIDGVWSNRKVVRISTFQYATFLVFLRYLITGSLMELELEWTYELLSLAIEANIDNLKQVCLEFLDNKVNEGNENLLVQMLKDSQKSQHALRYLSIGVKAENCCHNYELAVKHWDKTTVDKIVQFAANIDFRTLCSTDGYQMTEAKYIKDLFSKAFEFSQKANEAEKLA